MKQQINPAVMVVVIALVVVGVGYFLWHAATDKPSYPGLNAGHPAGESTPRQANGQSGGPTGRDVPNGPVTNEQARQMRIPGMNPNNIPSGQTPGR